MFDPHVALANILASSVKGISLCSLDCQDGSQIEIVRMTSPTSTIAKIHLVPEQVIIF